MDRKFGIEIEAYGVDSRTLASRLTQAGITCYYMGYTHGSTGTWKIVSDSSIGQRQSFELVSPPLQGVEGFEQLKVVCKVLAELNARVGSSCGLHVHIDAADMEPAHYRNLLKLCAKFETCMDSLIAESRRGNGNYYARSMVQGSITQTLDQVSRRTTLQTLQALYGYNRYQKLNLMTGSHGHQTVEFRAHHGTTNFRKIEAWTYLVGGLVERAMVARSINARGSNSFDTMLRAAHVPGRIARFLRARRREMNPAIAERERNERAALAAGAARNAASELQSRTEAARREFEQAAEVTPGVCATCGYEHAVWAPHVARFSPEAERQERQWAEVMAAVVRVECPFCGRIHSEDAACRAEEVTRQTREAAGR